MSSSPIYRLFRYSIPVFALFLSILPLTAQAELATQEEARVVCEHWLMVQVDQHGSWAGSTNPTITSITEITEGDNLLGYYCEISPNGFVMVPALKSVAPVKASSMDNPIEFNGGGIGQFIKDDLTRTQILFVEYFNSLDYILQGDLTGPFSKRDIGLWGTYLVSDTEFQKIMPMLGQGTIRDKSTSDYGPLLTSGWHQGAPYNNDCPVGDTTCTACPPNYTWNPPDDTVVGCVATATAQIMYYHQWPPSGTGTHSYSWDGDDSCENAGTSQTLTVTLSDPYDWANMLDNTWTGSPAAAQAAVAELSYEVAVAYEMDFGVCGSGSNTYKAVNVLPTFFDYSTAIRRENRDDFSAQEWFDMIADEIDLDRPILYRVAGHAIVADGWQVVGGLNQYHMNYGWSNARTTWYTVDNLHLQPESEDEYLVINIIPNNSPPDAVCQDVTVDADENCDGNVTADMVDGGSTDPDGDPLTLTLNPPGPYALGTTAVTLTVEDNHGASDSCTATVTVLDTTPPMVTCPGNIMVECTEAGGVPASDSQLTAFLAGFTAEDNCDADLDIMNDAPLFFGGPCEAGGGVTVVTWSATDDSGNEAYCSASVTVVDTTPPEIEVTVTPQVLWPVNHKMVEVEYTVVVGDICDDAPDWVLVSVTSNEPDDGLGDGTTEPDIMDVDVGTADVSISLRAERSGTLTGRVYQATFQVTDCSGNTSITMANVYVPHAISDIGTIISNSSGLEDSQSEVSYMVSGASLWPKEIPVEFNDHRTEGQDPQFVDPLSAFITNTAGLVNPNAFFLRDVDGDQHKDILMAFDRRALMTLAYESTEEDGDPVMVLEIGPEKFIILGMSDIQDIDLDLGELIAKLRGEEEMGDELTVDNTEVITPRQAGLIGAAPNPFNPSTTISYYIPNARHVELAIFDISGRLVDRLVSQTMVAGEHSVVWHGTDARGSRVASGVYFYRMTAGEIVDTKRMILIK